nr:sigma-70 family RNA polymerase sigma factor [Pelotomaculum isophthalicicum]
MENSGVIGLIKAVERYKPESGTSFGKFAYKHIYGAMMDEMRRQGWYPKRVWKKIKNVIASQELRDITETNEKEASMLNHYAYNRYHVPLEKTVNYSCGGSNMLLKYALEDETCIDPLDCMITEDEKKILYNAIDKLPEREKTVIISYYFKQMGMKKIGEKLHLSSSRVCQLHKKSLDNLKDMLLHMDSVPA